MSDGRTEAGRRDIVDEALRALRTAILGDDRTAAMVHLDDGTTAGVVALTPDARELLNAWWVKRYGPASVPLGSEAPCPCEACRVRRVLGEDTRAGDVLGRELAETQDRVARSEEGATRDLGRP